MTLGRYRREAAPAIAFAGLLLVVAVLAPSFFSGANLRDLALNSAPVLLVAIGMTLALAIPPAGAKLGAGTETV